LNSEKTGLHCPVFPEEGLLCIWLHEVCQIGGKYEDTGGF